MLLRYIITMNDSNLIARKIKPEDGNGRLAVLQLTASSNDYGKHNRSHLIA